MGFEHLLEKAREGAAHGIVRMTLPDKLAVALLLNRHDWLTKLDFTMVQALERLGDKTMALLPDVVHALDCEREAQAANVNKVTATDKSGASAK